MANFSSTSSAADPLSSAKENLKPMNSRIAELNESRTELFSRIQCLKQDLQNWRSKLDTQVKIYRDELTELKKSLNLEVEQLRSEFQDLRTTLQQQQEDVTASLKKFELHDALKDEKAVQDDKGNEEDPKESKIEAAVEISIEENNAENPKNEGNEKETEASPANA